MTIISIRTDFQHPLVCLYAIRTDGRIDSIADIGSGIGETAFIAYDIASMSYDIASMSYVKAFMSYDIRSMSYVIASMSYDIVFKSYVKALMSYDILYKSYDMVSMSYVKAFMSYDIVFKSYDIDPMSYVKASMSYVKTSISYVKVADKPGAAARKPLEQSSKARDGVRKSGATMLSLNIQRHEGGYPSYAFTFHIIESLRHCAIEQFAFISRSAHLIELLPHLLPIEMQRYKGKDDIRYPGG